MHTATENQMKSEHHTCIMYVCCIAKTRSLVEKSPRIQKIFRTMCHCASCTIPTALCDSACSHLFGRDELITDLKVNGKQGGERHTFFSPLKYQINHLRNCYTKRESDRQIYPTPALRFCLRCIIHLCANLEEPSQSPSWHQKDKKRERDGQTREKEVEARMSEKRREERESGITETKEGVRQMQKRGSRNG